ncbi:MAG: hypothetical protein GY757_12530, partial [bacterium]|nr:hypothetical protein [bacterium]
PHIRDLERYNCRYILGVKEGDHQYLFSCIDQAVQEGNAVSFIIQDEQDKDVTHHFKIVYDAPLNKSNQDIRVTFVEYSEKNSRTGKTKRFSWVTDLEGNFSKSTGNIIKKL